MARQGIHHFIGNFIGNFMKKQYAKNGMGRPTANYSKRNHIQPVAKKLRRQISKFLVFDAKQKSIEHHKEDL